MKYSITAEVVGLLFLEQPNSILTAEIEDARLELAADGDRHVKTLKVTLQAPPDVAEKMHSTFGPKLEDPNWAPPLTFDVDKQLDQAAQRKLQAVESVLSFMSARGSLVKVRWNEGAMSLIPETDDERRRVEASEVTISDAAERQPTVVSPQLFNRIASRIGSYDHLVEPMAFLREGINREFDGDYIQAYYAHYFVIEGLYGGGRSSRPEVLKAFNSSEALREACVATLASYFGPKNTNIKDKAYVAQLLSAQTEKDKKKQSKSESTESDPVSDLLAFCFEMRQQLHHYNIRSTRTQPHPFNQAKFRPLVTLIWLIAKLSLTLELRRIDNPQQKA